MTIEAKKAEILDWCSQRVECLARRKVLDLVGTLDAPQSSSSVSADDLADALQKADWSGCAIGNKVLLQGAIDLLRAASDLDARLKAAEYAARTNYEGWKQEVERNGGSML